MSGCKNQIDARAKEPLHVKGVLGGNRRGRTMASRRRRRPGHVRNESKDAVLAVRLLLVLLTPPLVSCTRPRQKGAAPGSDGGDRCAGWPLIAQATDHGQADVRIEALVVDGRRDLVAAGTWTGKLRWGHRTEIASERSFFVAKLSAGGAPLWLSELGVGSALSAGALAVDADGNALVAGSSSLGARRLPGRRPSAQLRRLDGSTGAILWEQDFAGQVALAKVDAVAGQGDAFVAGTTPAVSPQPGTRPARRRDLFVARLTREGTIRWQRKFGSNVPPLPPWVPRGAEGRAEPLDDVSPTAVVSTPEGPVVGGTFNRRLAVDGVELYSARTPAQFVIAFDGEGRYRWSFVQPSGSSGGLPLLSRTVNGVAALYRHDPSGQSGDDVRVACLDTRGKTRSERRIPFTDRPLWFSAPVFDRSLRLVAVSRSVDSRAAVSLTLTEWDCEREAGVETTGLPAKSFWPTAVAALGPSLLIAGCRNFEGSERCITEVRCHSGSHPAERSHER